jgi:hypothetical protein
VIGRIRSSRNNNTRTVVMIFEKMKIHKLVKLLEKILTAIIFIDRNINPKTVIRDFNKMKY